MPSNNLLESVNFEFNGYNGKDYWQHQGNDDNCAITSLLVAVNMLLGENRYTNNVSEWEKMGSYSEELGSNGGEQVSQWLEQAGLSDTIEITEAYKWVPEDEVDSLPAINKRISSRKELMSHLKNGEIVIASADGQVFKLGEDENGNPIYDSPMSHYVVFYLGKDGQVHCNNSAGDDPSRYADIVYNDADLDLFFDSVVGTVSLKIKSN